MVENTNLGCILFGMGVGMLIMAWFDFKQTSYMIDRFYDEQKALIRKFYGEMQEQSDKFFSIMKTYLPKEEDDG